MLNYKTRIDDLQNNKLLYVNTWKNNNGHLLTNKGVSFVDVAPDKTLDVLVASAVYEGFFDRIKNASGDDGILYTLKGNIIVAFDDDVKNDVFNEGNLFSINGYLNINSTANDAFIIKKLTVANLDEDQVKAVMAMFSVETPLTNMAILIPLSQVFDPDTSRMKVVHYPDDIKRIKHLNFRSDSKTLMLSKLFGKGATDDEVQQDLDFKFTPQGHILIPIIAFPTSVQQKLTMYFPWLDNNVKLDWPIASKFISANPLTDCFKPANVPLATWLASDAAGSNATYAYTLYLYKSLLAILILNKEYNAGYADFARDTESGKITTEAKIFETLLQAKEGLSIEATAADMMDNIINNYPLAEALGLEFQTFKQLIATLSRYLRADKYAVAKGGNRLNEVYLPYTLQNRNAPVVTGAPNIKALPNQDLKQAITSNITSRYFNISSTGAITVKPQFADLGFYQTIDIDQIISFAEVPEELEAITATTNLASLDLTKNDATKYLWYLAVDDSDAIKKIFTAKREDIPAGTITQPFSFESGIKNLISFRVDYGTSLNTGIGHYSYEAYFENNWINDIFGMSGKSLTTRITDTGNRGQVKQELDDYMAKFPDYTKITDQNIYDYYIKNIIPQGYAINKINNQLDMTTVKAFSQDPNVPYNGQITWNLDIYKDGWQNGSLALNITGTYTLITTQDINDAAYTNLQSIHDRYTFTNMMKTLLTKPYNIKIEPKIDTTIWKSIYSIPYVSVWGNKIDLDITYEAKDGTDKKFTLSDIRTFNINNEKNTLNILNLNINIV